MILWCNTISREVSLMGQRMMFALTAAGQMLEIAMVSLLPSRSKSIARPIVNTDMPTLPIAYAVLPRKNRLYTGGLTTTILPAPFFPSPFRYKCGNTACTIP
jgi:hypothetical protein